MIPLLPLVTADEVAFWVCAPIAVLCGLGMLLARKPVHSAIFMAGVMVSLAVLYAAQDAPFLFVIQIVVYTGAILMLFLFVVMLIGVDSTDSVIETIKGHRVATVLVVVAFAALLIFGLRQAFTGGPAGLAEANAEYGGNVEGIAALLFRDYVFLFEATAALLITGAVGAMVLAHGERITRKKTQIENLADRVQAYAADGAHPGPLPSSGVFARHNAISTPALLPDGSLAEQSISKTLQLRGVAVNVEELRAPTVSAYAAIAASQEEDDEGEDA